MRIAIVAVMIGLTFTGCASTAAHAADRSLYVKEGSEFKRITAEEKTISLIGRQQGSSLVCVKVDGVSYWAKPELWMPKLKIADVTTPLQSGNSHGKGNGIGTINELPLVSDETCR